MNEAIAEIEKLSAIVVPYVMELGATLDMTGRDAVQLCGVAVVSWLGAHAITQGDMRK